jgi:hypothetical protein
VAVFDPIYVCGLCRFWLCGFCGVASGILHLVPGLLPLSEGLQILRFPLPVRLGTACPELDKRERVEDRAR